MDKKIILSVLIVALIGIVAATYQINTGEDILNPLASVETEDSTPITDVLTAPETQEQAQADAQAKAQADAQAQAQQQQAQDEAAAKAAAENGAGDDSSSQSQSAAAGSTQASASIISSDNPLTIVSNAANGESSNDGGSSDNGGSSGNAASSDNGGSGSSDGSSDNGGSSGSNVVPADNSQGQQDNQDVTPVNTIDDNIWNQIQSVIQTQLDNAGLKVNIDDCTLVNDEYQVKAYTKDTNEFAGTFFVKPSENSWYFIDRDGNPVGNDVNPPSDNLGELDTSGL